MGTDFTTIIWQTDKIIFKFDGEFFGAVNNPTLLEPFRKHEVRRLPLKDVISL